MTCAFAQVPGERLLPAGSPGARPGSDRSGAEHRHDALPRRHCVHCQVHDFRLPVCGDAERPTLDLSGEHPYIVLCWCKSALRLKSIRLIILGNAY